MARIRTIKPDFWEDEAVGELSPLARLLFIGSWNMADDEGLLRWTPDYLNASLLMYDGLTPARVRKLMDEIEAMGMVFVYTGGKAHQTLAYVVNFRKHQRINRPQPSRLPPPSLQNPATCEMYARRDNWTCHICKGPINAKKVGHYDGYDNDVLDDIQRRLGDERLNFSPDHLIPRSKGGSDYPSNIAASHVSCNKSRGARPLPMDVTDSLNRSVNQSRTGSPPEVEEEGNKEVEGISASSPSDERREAERIVNDWWEGCHPKPVTKWIAVVKVVQRFLEAGHFPPTVAQALHDAPTPTVAALEFQINQPAARKPPTTAVERSWRNILEDDVDRPRSEASPARNGHSLAATRALEAGT